MKKGLTALAGFAHLEIIIAIVAVAALALIGANSLQKQAPTRTQASESVEITAATTLPTPTPSPTPEPTPEPTPVPTPEATLAPTPIPTPQPVAGPPGAGHSRITVSTEVGNFLIDVVSIDMAGGAQMITDTASDNDCGNECPVTSLADYVARNGGFAGINGSYFCPSTYGSCAGKSNSFDFPVYNTRLNKWINGRNLFWNNRSIIFQDGGGMHFNRNASSFGGGLRAGVVNHPGLVDGGAVIADQFPLEAKQTSKGTKGGIGIRGSVVYLVIARNVNVNDFGHVFKSLGASHALNLDGGGSVALWFGGYKVGPGRNLPNAIIFK